jgi:hypothetical protein
MEVRDIVRYFLKNAGYEGLAGQDCGCELDDLMPCDDTQVPTCETAMKVPCNRDEDYGLCDGNCDWHMEATTK